MTDAPASYAVIRARIEIRLLELREALDRHEADQANWTRPEVLARVDSRLVELLREVACP